MTPSELHTRYQKLFELSFEYRTHESNWLRYKASSDKEKMDKARTKLDRFLIEEKQRQESKKLEFF